MFIDAMQDDIWVHTLDLRRVMFLDLECGLVSGGQELRRLNDAYICVRTSWRSDRAGGSICHRLKRCFNCPREREGPRFDLAITRTVVGHMISYACTVILL